MKARTANVLLTRPRKTTFRQVLFAVSPRRRFRSKFCHIFLLTQFILLLYIVSKVSFILFQPVKVAKLFSPDTESFWQKISRNGSYIDQGTDWNRVAIGCGVTSVGITDITRGNFRDKFPFFTYFLPSFCKTASAGYVYPIYLAFDRTDPVFNNLEWLQLFHQTFDKIVTSLKCNTDFKISLNLVQCSHERRPAWAQNDAMMEAYIDGATFFYRVNDDTDFQTSQWTEKFIKALARFEPPFIGVVGPKHTGGNQAILTYDFVHRNHIDIFGFYYPRAFTGWFADDWITKVYQQAGKMKKLSDVSLVHKFSSTRYPKHTEKGELLPREIDKHMPTLNRFIKWLNQLTPGGPSVITNMVISLCMNANTPDVTFGAMQNARLAPVHFPGWKIRVYITDKTNFPHRILQCLKSLKVDIRYASSNVSSLPQSEVCHLVAADQNVDYFIVRSASGRLSERDAAVVREWMDSRKPIHTIRDHLLHKHSSIVNTLWGGMPRKIKTLLPEGSTFTDHLLKTSKASRKKSGEFRNFGILRQGLELENEAVEWQNEALIEKILYTYLKDHSYCHDSIVCHPPNHRCRKFPMMREDKEHLGQDFQAMGMPIVRENAHSNEIVPINCREEKKRT